MEIARNPQELIRTIRLCAEKPPQDKVVIQLCWSNGWIVTGTIINRETAVQDHVIRVRPDDDVTLGSCVASLLAGIRGFIMLTDSCLICWEAVRA